MILPFTDPITPHVIFMGWDIDEGDAKVLYLYINYKL